jgi:hypothetical protein
MPRPNAPSDHQHTWPREQLSARGFTLVELTVAGALLGVALLALAPLYTSSVRALALGRSRAEAAIEVRNGLERWAGSLPPEGASGREYFSFEERAWSSEPPVETDLTLYVREGTVRYLELDSISDGLVDAHELREEPSLLAWVEHRVEGDSSMDLAAVVVRIERVAE